MSAFIHYSLGYFYHVCKVMLRIEAFSKTTLKVTEYILNMIFSILLKHKRFIKTCWEKTRTKWNYIFEKLSTSFSTATQKISPKTINLSNVFLTKHEMKILKHGISFPPKPKLNISQVETQIYNVVRKLGLT